jgi:uncharacterized protein YcnI
MRTTASICLAALALVFVPSVMAHATMRPASVRADSVARIVLQVEGERSVPAVRVAVQLPHGVSDVSVPRVPGWKRTVSGRVVTWSGGSIGHGQFGRFALSARFPDSPGKELAFPTVQTYANGEVVRWIGPASSDTPAPRLTTIATVQDEEKARTATWAVAAGIALGLFVIGLAFWWRRRG